MRRSLRDLGSRSHHSPPPITGPGSKVMNRREFLQAGAASGGLVFSGRGDPASGAVSTALEAKRVGLIGAGWYGKIDLLRLLQVAPVEVVRSEERRVGK